MDDGGAGLGQRARSGDPQNRWVGPSAQLLESIEEEAQALPFLVPTQEENGRSVGRPRFRPSIAVDVDTVEAHLVGSAEGVGGGSPGRIGDGHPHGEPAGQRADDGAEQGVELARSAPVEGGHHGGPESRLSSSP